MPDLTWIRMRTKSTEPYNNTLSRQATTLARNLSSVWNWKYKDTGSPCEQRLISFGWEWWDHPHVARWNCEGEYWTRGKCCCGCGCCCFCVGNTDNGKTIGTRTQSKMFRSRLIHGIRRPFGAQLRSYLLHFASKRLFLLFASYGHRVLCSMFWYMKFDFLSPRLCLL